MAVIVLAACGGGGDSPGDSQKSKPPPPATGARDDMVDPVDHGTRDPKQFQAEAADSFAEAARTATGEGSRLEQAQERLPIREPPLPIQQYVLTDGSHDVVARLDSRDFFCIGDQGARRAAIEAYFDQAETAFRKHDIDDFSLTVALNSEDINHFKVLARAHRAHGVKLTERGRSDRC